MFPVLKVIPGWSLGYKRNSNLSMALSILQGLSLYSLTILVCVSVPHSLISHVYASESTFSLPAILSFYPWLTLIVKSVPEVMQLGVVRSPGI